MPRRKKDDVDINASSMADIAFLLLIFFLVTTTIASDKGLPILLPPKNTEDVQIKLNQRNVYVVQMNSRDQLLVEDEPMELRSLKEGVKRFLSNNGADEKLSVSPKDAVVSIKADRGTSYETYLQVLDQVKAGYHELRAQEAGITVQEYLSLEPDKNPRDKRLYDKAREAYPMQISEAEPSQVGG
ncbi:Biopolymer transport protein ExbD [Catalinimonas alkaloidigena]|uniref:Biopolymer transport protein ExbD n=1 Tax=Catalinimonas alkaloidigena TaxID=1075417 RepID=A0A1G8WHY9_9BACT|nr:biopolymer transporter ExbD [Catalinimonas alkaloidigena]SDJ77942.1 Biopolymer transport protein ExbD [Catalinimonas alkaloidigena]